MTKSDQPQSTKMRVIHGVIWHFGGRLGSRLIGLVNVAVLTRLLDSSDFGIFALAMSVFALADVLRSTGTGSALMRESDADIEDYRTCWSINLLANLTVALLVMLAAYPAADFFDDPRVAPVLLVIAMLPLVNGLENVALVDLYKEFSFKQVIAIDVRARLAGALTSVSMALWTGSYWALVAGTFATAIFRVVQSYWVKPFSVRFTLSRWRKFAAFSGLVVSRSLVGAMRHRISLLLLGRANPSEYIGYYSMALNIPELIGGQAAAPIHASVQPALVKAKTISDLRIKVLVTAMGSIMIIFTSALFGLGLTAEAAITILAGDKWIAAAPLLSLAVLPVGVSLGRAILTRYLLFCSRLRGAFIIDCIALVLLLGLLLVVDLRSAGETVIIAIAAIETGILMLLTAICCRMLPGLFRPLIAAMFRPLLSGAVMVFAVLSLPQLGQGAGFWQLVMEVVVGASAYGAALWGVWRLSGRPDGAEALVFDQATQGLKKLFPKTTDVEDLTA